MDFESHDLLGLAHGTEVWLECLCDIPAIIGDDCFVGDSAGLRRVAARRLSSDDRKEAGTLPVERPPAAGAPPNFMVDRVRKPTKTRKSWNTKQHRRALDRAPTN